MILIDIGILVIVALGVWWLTGRDKNISGESRRDQHLYRAIRVVLVTFLLAVLLFFPFGPAFLIVPMSIALLMRSSISEFFAHGFMGFLDPSLHDSREIDLNQTRRYQDTIAHLIHTGHKDEAIKLCEELKKSDEVDILTLESTLEFLGVKQERAGVVRPLHEAARLRAQGKFIEAEQMLKELLVKNSADTHAAMLLMRLYAQDLRQPGKAAEVLRALEKQPHVAAAHLEFARRSIDEWSRSRPEKTAAAGPPAETVDELLARGFIGSAIELLERQITAQPRELELRLRLAEVQAVKCANLPRAEKIIRQIEADKNFTPAQAASARARLKEWHEAGLQRK